MGDIILLFIGAVIISIYIKCNELNQEDKE